MSHCSQRSPASVENRFNAFENDGARFETMEALRASTKPYSKVKVSSFYGDNKSSFDMFWDGSTGGEPTASGDANVIAALSADSFITEGGYKYKFCKNQKYDLYMVGAKGGGSVGGSVNDTAAVQAAVNIFDKTMIPANDSFMVDSITWRSRAKLVGYGEDSVIIQNSVGSSNGIIFADSGSSSAWVYDGAIRNCTLYGEVETLGFAEHTHLVNLNGVRDFELKKVNFKGPRGDGLYLGSGTAAGDERHNVRVRSIWCNYDGINKTNRNPISVIDCENFEVIGGRIERFGRSDMPGGIDIEPDSYVFYVCRNIKIKGVTFGDMGGNVACVSFNFMAAKYTKQPQNFRVIDCESEYNVPFVAFLNNESTYTEKFNLLVRGNTGQASRLVNFGTFIDGFIVSDNAMTVTSASLLGYNGTDIAKNGIWSNNILMCSSAPNTGALVVASGSELQIKDSTWIGFYDYCIAIGGSTSTVTNTHVTGNVCSGMRSAKKFVLGNGGISGESCSYLNNKSDDATVTHNFPAWITDDCGSVLNGTTAVSFNSATLPDSFPVGESMALINGDTGVPATGGYQGTLVTKRPNGSSSSYAKWIYQEYWPANNGTKLGSFYVRKRDTTTNTWTAFVEQAA